MFFCSWCLGMGTLVPPAHPRCPAPPQVLYETRCASLQRLVGFFVLFHAMGRRVEGFWSYVSFGVLAYDMSRTQSMMRVATTASPVSGMDI